MKLQPVPQGAGISIVAPASFARQERVELGIEALRGWDMRRDSPSMRMRAARCSLRERAEQRVADLHAAFADPETQIVMSLRGGYGSNYFCRGLDLELIRKHPKPFFAYSDLTGIQLRLLDELGLPAFHGPMLAADFYLEDGVHLPSFHARWPASRTAWAPAKGCAR